MDAVRRAFVRLGALPPRFKAGLLGVVALAAVALGWGLNATRDARVALFATPLYADQLTEVQNRLAGWGVPYAQTRDAWAADLEQGLRGLDGVADARVIVAPASAGAYADEAARDASA